MTPKTGGDRHSEQSSVRWWSLGLAEFNLFTEQGSSNDWISPVIPMFAVITKDGSARIVQNWLVG